MIEIGIDETNAGVLQKDISDKQQISLKYLDNIIASLKTSGLIVNARGRKSGYKLARRPSEITILDILNSFEPGISIVDCVQANYNCILRKTCGVKDFWNGLNDVIINYFVSRTLEDLINSHKSKLF